mgnify:CR=1 FL=1
MRGVPLAGEALVFDESVRRQQDGNSVFSLTRLQEGGYYIYVLTQLAIP